MRRRPALKVQTGPGGTPAAKRSQIRGGRRIWIRSKRRSSRATRSPTCPPKLEERRRTFTPREGGSEAHCPKIISPMMGTVLARLSPPSRMRRGSRQVDVHIIAQSMRAERSSPFVARVEEARAPPRSHARAVPATVPRCPRFETRLSDNRSLRRFAMVLRAPH